ncbi:HAD-IA family hydrolase [Granulicella sp. S156]|jgi:sugar-phosphatase|uniref:HAD-IA family hydrolase n=1 Tax=Granulicella sp. S156 TaxID=1747224 RepID=UPI00131CFD44|nr:HAD-IA family hydrolase [Granulicella sp. S156]
MSAPDSKGLKISVRAVLFDMDGVLISSIEADERSWLRWAKLHGMEATFSIHSTHGRRTIDTIRALRPDLDLTTELERMEDFDAEDTAGLTVYPGVRELLAGLQPTQWSIVTSASDRVMRHRLGTLGLPVPPKVVTSESVSLGKPSPEPYQLGASQLGLIPADCLVIEDSPSGIRAAKTAGCFVIAVASSHAPEELKEADWIVESLKELELDSAADSDRLFCHRSS